MRLQNPAMASSTELSTTSQTRWCKPRGPVLPMYMAGRRRTASRPSRTWMSLASYEPLARLLATKLLVTGAGGRPMPRHPGPATGPGGRPPTLL